MTTPAAASPESPRRRWPMRAVALVCLIGAGLLAGVLVRGPRNDPAKPAPEKKDFPLPGLSASPFLNTRADASYVGSAVCTGCHQTRTASFRSTGMGISMAAVDEASEPPDASFEHPRSKKRYQVQRKDGQIWHRELALADGPEVVLSEYPLKYAVGSGRHAKTYLVEAEGFLVESPVSWYASRKQWGMSPGYDRPDHMGFQRAIGEGCLICHAGHAEAVDRTLHRMHVKEAAIGCERCHGPGSLHVDHHKAGKPTAEDIDYTIVNPRHLSRDLAEAVCQQCHLHSAAAVPTRGRKPSDFRPGLPLTDFRQDYYLELDRKPMTVVGHVEQMHLSRCYTQTKTFTCATCHNPHAFPAAEERVAYYRKVCMSCHETQGCTIRKDRLERESPENNCVKCHMPASDTEVPHVSFTHHRVAVHERLAREKQAEGNVAGTLRPLFDYPNLGEADRNRSLGIAYFEMATDKSSVSAIYRNRAFDLLSAVRAAGLKDAAVEARLARLHFEREEPEAFGLAQAALSEPLLPSGDRCLALFVLGGELLKQNRLEAARTTFRELVQTRRHAHDWMLLADCEKALGNGGGATEALRRWKLISPR